MELGSAGVGVDIGCTTLHALLGDGRLMVAGTKSATTAGAIAGGRELARGARVTDLGLSDGAITAARTRRARGEWPNPLQLAQMPCVQVHRAARMPADRHLETPGLPRALDHPADGKLRLPRFPLALSVSAAQLGRLGPRNGVATSARPAGTR